MKSGWMGLCLFGMLVLVVGSGISGSPPAPGHDPSLGVHAHGAHKLLVLTEDRPALDRLSRLGVVQRQVDYESFRLLVVGDRAVTALSERALSNVMVRDDFDLVTVNRWTIDTREGEPKDLPGDRLGRPGIHERQLYLVQFIGPSKNEWLADLKGNGDLEVVSYLPSNAYAVFASPAAWQRMSLEASRPGSVVQWAGIYHPAYRISPDLEASIARGDHQVDVVVEFVEHPGVRRSVTNLMAQASGRIMDDVSLGGLRDVRVRIPASLIPLLAAEPDVFWIEPCLPKELFDEAQGQIVAGNLDINKVQPSAPGYLAWLNSKGFTSNFPFTVDVADDGFEQGDTTNVHQDFKDAGGVSRVTYVSIYTDPGVPDDSTGGHGSINAAIMGGYNNTQGTSYEDASGYQYGLGIAPYARIGASKIFADINPTSGFLYGFTFTPYSTLIGNAYNNGARISSNSWGTQSKSYNTDSRSYDFLVRDAVQGTAGNQEMAIVFAAGNEGSGFSTVTAPGTAKNVLTVGASENFRQTGTDGCGYTNAAANNAKDMASFSSRGPVVYGPEDTVGRHKPDLVAPGTHIQGAASSSPSYTGFGVCAAPGAGNNWWPITQPQQTLYTWSSGTSQATAAVAGAAALTRQWFANQGWGTPSPAMTKAFLMATPTYMTGVGANDTLPSHSQGYGRVDLGRAFDGTPSIRVDQSHIFGAPGAEYTVTGNISDSSRPFRVMLAWTDAPGSAVAGIDLVNNLNLEVTLNGDPINHLYRGNVFSGPDSVPGGGTDSRNNTEGVFLPAGTSGSFSITVRAITVNGDGVPGNANLGDQDFALFVYNGTSNLTISATPSSYTVTQGGGTSYAVTVGSVNGFSSSTNLAVTGLPLGATYSFSPNPVTPPIGGSVGSILSVTTSKTTPAGGYTLTITGTSGALSNTASVILNVQTQVFTHYAAPVVAIPDNDTIGVTSGISVSTSMAITSVSVYLNITHPNAGDLKVSLIGPDGTTAVLHDINPADTSDNIVTTYNITTQCNNQCLSVFSGKNASGTWTLKVQDLADSLPGVPDGGILNSWNVTFSGSYGLFPYLTIPDNDTGGVRSTINVPATGKVDNLRVRVWLANEWISDLEVLLIAPDGTTVLLHNRTGGFAEQLSTVYPDVDAPYQSLSAFTGKGTHGAWTLWVRDLHADTLDPNNGILYSWEIDFATGQGVELTLIEFPNFDAGPNQGVPFPSSGFHYLKVDDDPHDGDATAILFPQALTKEVYTIADHLLPSDRITSVKVRWVAKKGGDEPWEARAGLVIGTQEYCQAVDCPAVELTDSYVVREETFLVNPETEQPWTVQAVRDLKLFYEQISVVTQLPRAKLTEIALVVTLGRIPNNITLTELPNSDAGPNQGGPNPSGPHYLNVDDEPNDGNSTVLQFTTGGAKEVFTTADQLHDSDRITSVKVRWVAKKGSGNEARAGLVMASPGMCPAGECYGPTVELTGNYVVREETFLANPASGLLWSVQDVRSAKLIYHHVSGDTQLPKAKLPEIVLVIEAEQAPLVP